MTNDAHSAPEGAANASARGGLTTLWQRAQGTAAGRNAGLVLALFILFAIGAFTAGERFMKFENLLGIVLLGAIIGVIAIGATFVIIAGGIDLSVGSVMGLSTVVITLAPLQQFFTSTHWSLMIIVAMAIGGLAGAVNGIVIAYGKVAAFMASLAMLLAARGLAELLANKMTLINNVTPSKEFFRLAPLGVDILIWIFAIVAVLGWLVLNRTTFGRRTVAIGGNSEASRLAGIDVRKHTLQLYVLAGALAGLAGFMMVGRTGVGTSTHGLLYELDAIAAVVVGGTLLAGGRGTIVGTVFGVLIFSTLLNLFTQNNLSTSVQAIAKGTIIVLAVLLQQRFAATTGRQRRFRKPDEPAVPASEATPTPVA